MLELMDSGAARTMMEEEYRRQKEAGKDCSYLTRALGIKQGSWVEKRRSSYISWILGKDWKKPAPEDPIPALLALLKVPNGRRRRCAIEMLVELDHRSAAVEIAKLASDENWEVRASVACALKQWDAEADVLETLAADPNPAVRWLAKNRLH
jgi:hypothetical protein